MCYHIFFICFSLYLCICLGILKEAEAEAWVKLRQACALCAVSCTCSWNASQCILSHFNASQCISIDLKAYYCISRYFNTNDWQKLTNCDSLTYYDTRHRSQYLQCSWWNNEVGRHECRWTAVFQSCNCCNSSQCISIHLNASQSISMHLISSQCTSKHLHASQIISIHLNASQCISGLREMQLQRTEGICAAL